MLLREERIAELKDLLVTPTGWKQIVELYRQVYGDYPAIGKTPYTVIEAIADQEYRQRIVVTN